MTPTQQQDLRRRDGADAQVGAAPVPADRQHRETVYGRPRSAEGEEAYLRSAREQAAIDIAAGW